MPVMAPRQDVETPNQLPTLLAEWLRESGWTQRQVAKELGVTEETISRWKKGRPIQRRFLGPLSQLLDQPIAAFYGTEDASHDGLGGRLDVLEQEFQIAFEDLLDRTSEQAERIGTVDARTEAIETQLSALIDQLRAQGMGELRDLGKPPQKRQTGRAGKQKPGRSSGR